MKLFLGIMLFTCFFPFATCEAQTDVDNSPVKIEDLDRYLGRWYEIARFDHSFERGQTNTSAFYALNDDGSLMVKNTGIKNGKQKQSVGKAKLTDVSGLMRVSFFWPFYSDYRVLMLAADYSYALIGGKSDKYLWILARTPNLKQEVVSKILKEAKRRKYDTSNLIWVNQADNIARLRKIGIN